MSARDGLDGAAQDWNEAMLQGYNALRIGDTEWSRTADFTRGGAPALKPVSLDELLKMELKPRAPIIGGLLHERGIIMAYAWRGVGKTWFALSLAYAIAAGGSFLRWETAKPRRVLYIDGEMPAVGLRERVEPIVAACETKPPEEDYFRFLPADLHESGLPNLATEAGQAAVDAVLGNAEVVIFDNVSTLFISGRENEAESWLPVQTWLLKLRRDNRPSALSITLARGNLSGGPHVARTFSTSCSTCELRRTTNLVRGPDLRSILRRRVG
jgi:hypothetical protein